MKYLVWLIVLVIFYVWWHGQRRKKIIHPTPKNQSPPKNPQDIVACHHCGLHLPLTESLTIGPRHYCCVEHQRKDAGVG